MLDMGGSIGGDMLGRLTSDQILKAKDKISGGEGLTPYEKMGQQQQMEMLQAGKVQALAELRITASWIPKSYDRSIYRNGS